LPVEDFYADWARVEFGAAAAPALAAIFARMDGRLPRPADWTDGPGGIKPDARPWAEVAPLFAFVDEIAAAAPTVTGAAEQERFHYWLHTFRYLRAMAKVACGLAACERAMLPVRAADAAARADLALQALPARIALVAAVREVYSHLLAIVGNPGELGTIANWEQHLLPALLDRPGDELATALGTPLPQQAMLPHIYDGPARVIVPTVRTSVPAGEVLALRVLVLAKEPPAEAYAWVRPMGGTATIRLPLQHVARGVYTASLPAQDADTVAFEYGVTAVWRDGRMAQFPATAPAVGQTVVVAPGGA
jgi:hypothetical protein